MTQDPGNVHSFERIAVGTRIPQLGSGISITMETHRSLLHFPVQDRMLMHNCDTDATEDSCVRRLRLHFPEEADKLMKGRYRFIK